MSKLRLDLEDLAVESFGTTPAAAPTQGTVDAYITYAQGTCPVRHCPQTEDYTCWYTCDDASCVNTCANTCPNTCAYTCDDYSCAYTCDCGGGTGQTECFGPSCAESCWCPV